MNEFVIPAWAKDVGVEHVENITALLPVYTQYENLPNDVKEYFLAEEEKKSCMKLRSFIDCPTFEFSLKSNEGACSIMYFIIGGEDFSIIANIENVIRPLLNQIAHFNVVQWAYEFHVNNEARKKCPVTCHLIDNYGNMDYGRVNIIQFPKVYRGVHLIYTDINDLYDDIPTELISKVLKIVENIANEVISAGTLTSTQLRYVKDAIRAIRMFYFFNR